MVFPRKKRQAVANTRWKEELVEEEIYSKPDRTERNNDQGIKQKQGKTVSEKQRWELQ